MTIKCDDIGRESGKWIYSNMLYSDYYQAEYYKEKQILLFFISTCCGLIYTNENICRNNRTAQYIHGYIIIIDRVILV
jgi:hypothetical protein